MKIANQKPLVQPTDMNALKALATELDAVDLSAVEYGELLDMITQFTKGQPGFLLAVMQKSVIFRCVKYTVRPPDFSYLIYPPKSLAFQNRANRKGEQYFYGSLNLQSALTEIGAGVGDFIMVAKWQVAKQFNVAQLGYRGKHFFNDRPVPEPMLAVYPNLDWSVKAFVDDYIAHRFAQKIDKSSKTALYELTNAIAENLLIKPQIEGILYPSIAMDEQNHNLVLKPHVVDHHLDLIHAQWVTILSVQPGTCLYTIEYHDIASRAEMNGTLIWENRPGKWSNVPTGSYFWDESGDQILKDLLGNTYQKS